MVVRHLKLKKKPARRRSPPRIISAEGFGQEIERLLDRVQAGGGKVVGSKLHIYVEFGKRRHGSGMTDVMHTTLTLEADHRPRDQNSVIFRRFEDALRRIMDAEGMEAAREIAVQAFSPGV